jgi:hypothetical protein
MHKGEIIFHIVVPLAIILATVAMGYYVVTLVFEILKMA